MILDSERGGVVGAAAAGSLVIAGSERHHILDIRRRADSHGSAEHERLAVPVRYLDGAGQTRLRILSVILVDEIDLALADAAFIESDINQLARRLRLAPQINKITQKLNFSQEKYTSLFC